MPKIFIFSFMKRNCIHIGPCFTDKDFRGRGYYPALLKIIMNDYRDRTEEFYIFCTASNLASQRGIAKAGFQCFGRGMKNKLGIYVLEKHL